MKKPSLEEVRERYKYAKSVKCASGVYAPGDGVFHIEDFTDLRGDAASIVFAKEGFDLTDNDQFVELWNANNGYAEIIEYKDNKPKHYQTDKGFDVIDFNKAYDLNFNLGSAVKYLARAGKKESKLEDLKKAIDFINREIEAL